MTEKSFKPESIQELKAGLTNIGKTHPNYAPLINELLSTIDSYEKENKTAFPEIMRSLDKFIDGLAKVEIEDAKLVSTSAKNCCRECMFHLDDCFVNSIFLIFKSIELEDHLFPNKTRPTLRFDSLQKAMQKLTERTNKA